MCEQTSGASSAGGFRVWPYVARPLDARKTHQEFLRGRKNAVVQRGKRAPRPLGLRRTAHVRSDAASAASPRATTNAPAQLPSAQRTCNLAVRRQSMPATPASGLCPKRAIQHQNKKPSAEFAPRANNSNKIPSEGVYLGGNSQFSPNTERLAIGQPFRVKSSRCAARIRARRDRRRRCRSRRC